MDVTVWFQDIPRVGAIFRYYQEALKEAGKLTVFSASANVSAPFITACRELHDGWFGWPTNRTLGLKISVALKRCHRRGGTLGCSRERAPRDAGAPYPLTFQAIKGILT